jgi:hypothetical protein
MLSNAILALGALPVGNSSVIIRFPIIFQVEKQKQLASPVSLKVRLLITVAQET